MHRPWLPLPPPDLDGVVTHVAPDVILCLLPSGVRDDYLLHHHVAHVVINALILRLQVKRELFGLCHQLIQAHLHLYLGLMHHMDPEAVVNWLTGNIFGLGANFHGGAVVASSPWDHYERPHPAWESWGSTGHCHYWGEAQVWRSSWRLGGKECDELSSRRILEDSLAGILHPDCLAALPRRGETQSLEVDIRNESAADKICVCLNHKYVVDEMSVFLYRK